jgi:hypothetical protein
MAFVMLGSGQQERATEQASARTEITAAYAAWGKARLAYDNAAYEKMLAPSFYAQLPGQKVDRAEFMKMVGAKNPQALLTRFDSQIITLTKQADDWVAVITEKLEFAVKLPGGKESKVYSVWVTRDGWHKTGNAWQVTFTEAIGSEQWRDTVPPIPGWKS